MMIVTTRMIIMMTVMVMMKIWNIHMTKISQTNLKIYDQIYHWICKYIIVLLLTRASLPWLRDKPRLVCAPRSGEIWFNFIQILGSHRTPPISWKSADSQFHQLKWVFEHGSISVSYLSVSSNHHVGVLSTLQATRHTRLTRRWFSNSPNNV